MKNKKKDKFLKPVSNVNNHLIVFLLLLVLVPSVLYFRVVNFSYSGLDDDSITRNINDLKDGPLNLNEAFAHDAFMDNKGETFYRPIQTVSLMLDAQIGGKDPWIYHLSNLILHILTVIALFYFLKKIGIRKEISFLISILFSIHPLFTNAVAWIPARGDILLCLFCILSFITLLEYLESRKIIYLVIHTLVFLLGMFSKETAVIIPVLLLSYIYGVQKKKIAIKEIAPFLIIWFFSFILFFSMRLIVIKMSPSSAVFGIIPFLKNLPTIPIIFFKFFIPYRLCTMPLFDNVGLIAGILLLIISAVLVIKIIPSERRIAIWGSAWFIAFSIPPMLFRSFIAANGIEYFEYRAYLPIIGILLIIGFMVNKLSEGISLKKVIMISIPIIFTYSVVAFIYSSAFEDSVLFFTSAITTNSNNAFALEKRGEIYLNKGYMDEALKDFDNSIAVCPTYSLPYFNMGYLFRRLNDHNKAEYFFSQALKYDTLYKNVYLLNENCYINLSLEKIILRKYEDSKSLLDYAIKIYPRNGYLFNNLGMLYFSISKFDSALIEYNKSINFEKNIASFYNNRGMAEYSLNDFNNALNDFNKVLELNRDFFETWGNRGMTKLKLNDYQGAVDDLTISIRMKEDAGAAWYYRGIAFSRLNKMSEAMADWKKAEELGYLDNNEHIDKLIGKSPVARKN